MREPPMDSSHRGMHVVAEEVGPARIWCEHDHAVWVNITSHPTPIGYRRDQVRTPDGAPLTWPVQPTAVRLQSPH